jgi:hypothetical protein
MEIELKIDEKGNPYLSLYAGDYGNDTLQDLLELFISRAKEKGLVVKNESSFETADDYISIRTK